MSEHIDSLHDLQIMARYNRWANARLYASVATLSDEDYRRDRGAFFGSIHATLNHILVGDRVWTSRIVGEYSGIKSLDEIVHDQFATLQSARTAMDEHIVRLVDRLSVGLDGGLAGQVRYRSVAGRTQTVLAGAPHPAHAAEPSNSSPRSGSLHAHPGRLRKSARTGRDFHAAGTRGTCRNSLEKLLFLQ